MTAISVIIPAFRPQDFEGLIRSMTDNAEADAEWILVDDASGPDYDAVFTALPASVTLIRHTQNCRQGAARNTGLARAQGQWIKFLDADDWLGPGHLSALLVAAERGEEKTIPFAATKHLFPNGASHVNESWRDLEVTPEAQLARLLHAPFLSHCGALFPRDLLERLGGYAEGLKTDEDGDLLIRVLMEGYVFFPVEDIHYIYVHHHSGERVSADRGRAKLASRLRVCDRVEAVFADRKQSIPLTVRYGLALRLDKIALSYWDEDRSAALGALARARTLCPNYQIPGRWPVRVLRALGGPPAATSAARLYRRIRGRPDGGTKR